MLLTGDGRSVLGKTVPSVSSTALGLQFGPYSRPRAQFSPIQTSRPVNNIYLFWPEQKLSQLFSYLKNPFNMARFLWPIGDQFDRVPL